VLLLLGDVLGAMGVALFALLWGAVYNWLAPSLGGLKLYLQSGPENLPPDTH
jgi:uncharacterized membrane protein YdjX (TVP38/TMEM64 family)